MVRFTNIKVMNGYIYATETDLMEGVCCNIRVTLNRNSGEYYSDGIMTGSMIKALWNLRTCYYNNNCKLPDKKTIAWG